MNTQRIFGNLWFWLGFGLLLIIVALAIQNVTRPAQAMTNASSPIQAQSVPDAAVQGAVGYLQAHNDPSVQSVPEAGVQSVADFIRLHSKDVSTPLITDPAAQSVMDYLKAHGIKQSVIVE
jgi:hypothetical protein